MFFRNDGFESKNDGVVRIEVIFFSGQYAYCISSAIRKVMKKILVMFTMMMVAMVTFAKDIKTVVFTTTPQMHCAACENKIKSNLRFEKGIKSIETSVPDQTVTVQYNADKTTPEKLQKGFEKFGYKARILKDGEKVEKNTGEKCDLM